MILELSSFLPSHVYSVSGFLGTLFLLVANLVLFEIQSIRDGRLVIPIFEHKLVAEAH